MKGKRCLPVTTVVGGCSSAACGLSFVLHTHHTQLTEPTEVKEVKEVLEARQMLRQLRYTTVVRPVGNV
jgi:hypothetical protein